MTEGLSESIFYNPSALFLGTFRCTGEGEIAASFVAAEQVCKRCFFGGFSAPPVLCPYRSEQPSGFADGYDLCKKGEAASVWDTNVNFWFRRKPKNPSF